MKVTKRLMMAVVAALGFSLAFASGYSTVNSSIQVKSGEHTGNVVSVNGDIKIGTRAVVRKVKTVNGSVRLGAGSRARSVDSVNGSIHLARGVNISEDIDTVNGGLNTGAGVSIGGDIVAVNGDIEARHSSIGGSIEVTNSDLTLRQGTVVEGGIRVKQGKSHSFFGLFASKQAIPKITFGDNVVVKGPIIFERKVNLTVSKTARIPAIQYPNAK